MASPTARSGHDHEADGPSTRQLLLRAAMRRFTALGYDRATSRDIARDAGVSVALVNRYFGSKEGLFAAVTGAATQALARDLGAGSEDLVAAVTRHLDPRAWPEFGGENPLPLLLRPAVAEGRGEHDRRRALESVVARFSELAATGSPSPQSDVVLPGELALSLTLGVLIVRAALPDGALASADADALRALLVQLTAAMSAAE